MSAPFEIQPVYRYTLLPGLTSLVRIRTLPNAKCTLRPDGHGSPLPVLHYADPEGFLELHVRPPGEDESVSRLIIEADTDGETAQHVLELRASGEPTEQMPFPSAAVRWPPAEAQVRPALSLDESLGLADNELLERGYPPRPDADSAPLAFNTWRRMVSAPGAFVEPRTVSRRDMSHARRSRGAGADPSSPIWSGFVLKTTGGPYDWVSGDWIVPNVTGGGNPATYSSLWIGIDGLGTTDLVQAGTDQDTYTFYTPYSPFPWEVSIYWAWTEFLPQQQSSQQLTNFPVNPGDEIFCEVWIADAGQMPSLTGYFGVTYIANWTTSTYTYNYTPRGTTNVSGTTAEWIMERPTINGQLPLLSDYGSARMSHAVARRVDGSYVTYIGDTNETFQMVSGNDRLSTVSGIDSQSMQFTWHNFQ